MSQLDDALEELQGALDEDDLELICTAAQIVLAICGVIGGGVSTRAARRGLFADQGTRGGDFVPQGARRASDSDFEAFDPDELGIDPEEFDRTLWQPELS